MPWRYDGAKLRNPRRTPTDGVVLDGAVTRIGVFPYRLSDGTTRRELRHPEEVFSVDSLRTLKAAAVTDLHPKGGVDTGNWRKLSIGHVDNPRQEGDHVTADVYIQDANAITKLDAGALKELSCGYTCDLEMSPGIWQGERYDAIQRTIRYNHVAIGPDGWGRGGSTVSLRLDSGDAILDEGSPTMTIKIDGKEYTVGTPECEAALATQKARADAGDRAVLELATMRATPPAPPAPVAIDPQVLQAAVSARVGLVTKVQAHGLKLDDAQVTGATDTELMTLAIVKHRPTFKADGLSPDQVRAVFEFLPEAPAAAPPPAELPTHDTIHAVRGGTPPATLAPVVDLAEASRVQMRKDNRDAWRQPVKA